MPPVIRYSVAGRLVTRVLDRDEVVIGRGADCDVKLPESSVSRRHARIYRTTEGWRVADMGSRNGTRVNDLALTESVLRHGDRIVLPDTELTFVDDENPSATAVGSISGTRLADEPLSPTLSTMYRSAVDFSALASAGPDDAVSGRPASDRLARLVAVVSEASRAVLVSGTLDDTFRRMLDLVFEHMPVQRGFIMLWDAERRDLTTRCVKLAGGSESDGEIRFSRTIAEKVYKDKVAVLTTDALTDDRFAAGHSIVAMGIRSAMAAPVWHGERVEGLICVDTSVRSRAFDAFDLDLLSALGNHLAVALEQARLQHVALEKEKLDRELAVAREIQMAVLPRQMPDLPGYDLAGMSQPAEQTGGDIFDLVPLDDRRLMLLVGDATGHGIGPALSVTQVRAMLRIAVRLGADLDASFLQINNQLAQDLSDNRLVTAFLGVLDSRSHELHFHAGGQGPLLHYRAATDECRWRGATTVPMGFMEADRLKPAERIDLAPGDILGLITDGVFEYENPGGEAFERSRVGDVIRAGRGMPMAELAARLLLEVEAFGRPVAQCDDITIVLVRRLPD